MSSNGQHTYESVSVTPDGSPCCILWHQGRRPNGTKRQMFVDTPREGRPAIIHHKRRRCICDQCGSTIHTDESAIYNRVGGLLYQHESCFSLASRHGF